MILTSLEVVTSKDRNEIVGRCITENFLSRLELEHLTPTSRTKQSEQTFDSLFETKVCKTEGAEQVGGWVNR